MPKFRVSNLQNGSSLPILARLQNRFPSTPRHGLWASTPFVGENSLLSDYTPVFRPETRFQFIRNLSTEMATDYKLACSRTSIR
jgi:hypothetical protein